MQDVQSDSASIERRELVRRFRVVSESAARVAVWRADEAFRQWISGELCDGAAVETLDNFTTEFGQTRLATPDALPNDRRNGGSLLDEFRLTMARARNACDAIGGAGVSEPEDRPSSASDRRRHYRDELAVLSDRDPEFG